ncbi:integrase core domain-containing protein [Capsulimonas corticalis]|nr:integrase core domain-containing protein [Capsulimonas corticalis]
MPFKESSPTDQRLAFLQLLEGGMSHSEACRYFGISRPTGYKILGRYQKEGVQGLLDQSRAPHHSPQTTSQTVIDQILELKAKHPYWGPKKLKAVHQTRTTGMGCEPWPSLTTIGTILKTRGLVKSRTRRGSCPAINTPLSGLTQPHCPNHVWSVDYKGHFSLGDGNICYPLTMTDNETRFLLRCQALPDVTYERAWPYFVGAFREFGLPQVIRSDNGAPFAANSITGVSRLSLNLLKLGILPERIAPGKPQQNGRHERMHRTLKAETTIPPRYEMSAQQRRFDAWRQEYNEIRPHEGIAMATPASLFTVSPRCYPSRPPELEYPGGMKVMRVRPNGCIRWKGNELYLGEVLCGEPVGIDHYAAQYQAIYVGQLPIALIIEETGILASRTKTHDQLRLLRVPASD